MNFIPETKKENKDIPYFEDVKSADGWEGQTTTKTIPRLQAEVTEAITRLGGTVLSFQSGTFQSEAHKRSGFRIHYIVIQEDGKTIPGRIDIAALPTKDKWNAKRKEYSLKMALYMLRIALKGTWFLQQLSPGYAPLLPWMLADGERTVSQLWAESSVMKNLLPPGEEGFVEGEYRETN